MRVLIVKLSSLGDVVHTLPVACALRDCLPHGSTIGWLVEEPAAGVLAGHRGIDELIVVQPGWLATRRGRRGLADRLCRLRFEVAIDAQGLTRSAVAAWLSGAKRRIGFGGRWWQDLGQWFDNQLHHLIIGREASRLINNELVEVRSRHVVDGTLELLRPLGIEAPEVRFDLPVCARESTTVETWCCRALDQQEFALINPGGSQPRRRWPTKRFAEVASQLRERTGLGSVILWGTPGEQEIARQVADESNSVLAPRTTLMELASLARRASIVVSNDTGPLHLAAAVGVPCVGLFGDLPAIRNGPYGEGHLVLEKAIRGGTIRARQSDSNETVAAIAVDDVLTACTTILAR